MQKQPDSGRTIVGFEIRYFKMKSKSYFNTIQAQAEANAESAAQKVNTHDRILNEEIDKLEEKKLKDMKVSYYILS